MSATTKDRDFDFAWMKENLAILAAFSTSGFENEGRGVVLCDHSVDGVPAKILYVRQADVPQDDPETDRLVRAYLPEREMIIVLAKVAGNSSYRIGNCTVTTKPAGKGE
jgi:hypothetical protein